MFAYWTMGSSHGHFPLLECWMVNSREFRLPALEQNSRGGLEWCVPIGDKSHEPRLNLSGS